MMVACEHSFGKVNEVISRLESYVQENGIEGERADIVERGIVMTGGGSLLRELDTLLKEETNLPINTVDDPLSCVVLGTGKILDDIDLYEKVLMAAGRS